MKIQTTILVSALVLAAMLAACHKDDNDVPEPNPTDSPSWSVEITGGGDILPWRAAYGSITVSICGRSADTRRVVVKSSEDWLIVSADTLAADSIVAFQTITNKTGARREATLVFADIDNPALSANISLSQLSNANNSTNADAAREQLYVGYGYDIYKALENPMAVRTLRPILDYQMMVQQYNVASKYQLVQDCHLSRTEVRYVSSEDVHAYGRDLSDLQTGDDVNHFEGCIANCLAAEDVLDKAKGSLELQNLGHGSLEKAVAARIIDKAALIDLQRKGHIPYDDEFSSRLYYCRAAQGDDRRVQIQNLLADYGTHLVIQADLGGRIDYTFTMQKAVAFNSREEMRQEIEYTLGRIADADRTSQNRLPSSYKSQAGAITVSGGSNAARAILEADIKRLDGNGQIDPGHITDWLATINYSDHPEGDPNLEVIHFELMPLWDIVPDELRQDVMDATFMMANRSDCALPANFTGMDIYEVNMQGRDKALFNFSNAGEDGSLCRILYYDNEPILQVCEEYVPKIRTDKRVVVAYPIYKQHIRMNQGLFIGDGIHCPATVGFSGGDCCVVPIEECRDGERIDIFYYVNGNLLLHSPTVTGGLKGKARSEQDDCLMLYTNDENGAVTHRHPLVKIGSKFWTRRDIDHRMQFSEVDDGSNSDQMQGGILYTRFQWEPNSIFMAANSWTWGYEPNKFYDDLPNTKWYMPMSADVRELYAYLGFNPKALFKGQVSGWNAQFNGYYGQSDIHNKNRLFSDRNRALRYQGELNVISSKNSNTYSDACILVLNPDYTLEFIDDSTYKNSFRSEWRNNYYPLRAVRGRMYEYPTLTTIKQNMR